MALPYRTVSVISSPQFINLQPTDLNPLISKCQIKVFYLGENRNGSYISKQVARDMATSLRGAPIVGYYKESKQDFSDHVEQITLDDQGVHFTSLTKPYGFVSPDSPVWFQKFEEQDENFKIVQRQYLMTIGYIWTGQYPQARVIMEGQGRPQSMELEESSLEGHWAKSGNREVEFFIINDAIISKLCILGEDVEPCFEGASVSSQKEATTTEFSKELDKKTVTTLFSMMEQLKAVIEGENGMKIEKNTAPEGVSEDFAKETDAALQDSAESVFVKDEKKKEEQKKEQETPQQEEEEKTQTQEEQPQEEQTKDQEEEQKKGKKNHAKDEEKKKPSSKCEHDTSDDSLSDLRNQFNALQEKYNLLKQENEQLVEFKNQIELEEKDALIGKFDMLTEEDKAPVVSKKHEYSLEEIEEKLAVICFRKGVNFNTSISHENKTKYGIKEGQVTTFSVSNTNGSSDPDWVKRVISEQNKMDY